MGKMRTSIGGQVISGLQDIGEHAVRDVSQVPGQILEDVTKSVTQNGDQVGKQLEKGQSTSDDQQAQSGGQQTTTKTRDFSLQHHQAQRRIDQLRVQIKNAQRIDQEMFQLAEERKKRDRERWEQSEQEEQIKKQQAEQKKKKFSWDAIKDLHRQMAGSGEGAKKPS